MKPLGITADATTGVRSCQKCGHVLLAEPDEARREHLAKAASAVQYAIDHCDNPMIVVNELRAAREHLRLASTPQRADDSFNH